MIKKLRRRFIMIAMFSITLVLTTLVLIINIGSYLDTMRNLDHRLMILKENNGYFPKVMPNKPGKSFMFPGYTSEETPFDTRYFTVQLKLDGKVIMVNTGRIASVKTKEAVTLAQNLLKEKKSEGFYEMYKYVSVSNEQDVLYIFLNCEKEIRALRSLQCVSALVLGVGIALVYVLVIFLTRLAIRPAQESYAKQKRFITDASHEIKTPLAIIDANTEVIEMENGESEWTRSTRKQIKRLSDLTQKLIFLSKMDEENVKIEMHPFQLKPVLMDVIQSYDSLLQKKAFSFEVDEVEIYGNQEYITQMLHLLMDNAIKYSNPHGEISVSCSKHGKKTVLVFFNSAEQLPTGNLDMLFERFYREDVSRNSKTGGHGIGLSVVKAIVEAHKGEVHCESQDGKSITFTITL